MVPRELGRRTWLFVALGALGIAILGAELGAGHLVDGGYIEHRLAKELGGDLEVSIGDASFSLLARRVEATGVVISRPGQVTLRAQRIVASGLPLSGRGDGPAEVGELTIERPLFFFHPEPGSPGRTTRADGGDGAVLRLGRLRLANGTALAWREDVTVGPRQVLIRELEVDGHDLSFDGSGRVTGSREGLTWRAGPFLRVRADGLTQVTFDSLRASGGDSILVFSGGRLEPTLPDQDFFGRLEVREDRIRAVVPRIEARGFDFGIWPPDGLVARHVLFDAIEVDVLTNRRVLAGSSDPWLPHEIAGSFEGRLAIDTISVRGRIEYRDLPAEQVAQAGLVVFDSLEARIEGISNAPGAAPMVLDATLRLFGAPAQVRLEIPLDTDRFRLNARGRVGAFDLSLLNDLTIPLEGVEIRDGRLEALRYDVTVDGPSAGGTVWVAYRNLDVQMVDRRTGKGGLIDKLKSFVANTFALRGENMPADGDAGTLPGAVEHSVNAGDSFFTRIWAPIRSGLLAITRK